MLGMDKEAAAAAASPLLTGLPPPMDMHLLVPAGAPAAAMTHSPSSSSALLEHQYGPVVVVGGGGRQLHSPTHYSSHSGGYRSGSSRPQTWRRWLKRRWRRTARFCEEQRRFFCGEPWPSAESESDVEEEDDEEEGSLYDGMEDGGAGEPASALRQGHRGTTGGRRSSHQRGSGVLNRTTTISVEFLKRQDRRPLHLAWAFFLVYVVRVGLHAS